MTTKTTEKPKTTKRVRRTYLYAVGRRKSAVARVRLYKNDKESSIIINEKKISEYATTPEIQRIIELPLKVVSLEKFPKITIKVSGGGIMSQADAIKLGIARILLKFEPKYKDLLKAEKMFTRDPRVKERKKPGLKRARKAAQWSKR